MTYLQKSHSVTLILTTSLPRVKVGWGVIYIPPSKNKIVKILFQEHFGWEIAVVIYPLAILLLKDTPAFSHLGVNSTTIIILGHVFEGTNVYIYVII